MEYIILERNGKFFIGYMKTKRNWFTFKKYKEFVFLERLGKYIPFDTLEYARIAIEKLSKPDVYHS